MEDLQNPEILGCLNGGAVIILRVVEKRAVFRLHSRQWDAIPHPANARKPRKSRVARPVALILCAQPRQRYPPQWEYPPAGRGQGLQDRGGGVCE